MMESLLSALKLFFLDFCLKVVSALFCKTLKFHSHFIASSVIDFSVSAYPYWWASSYYTGPDKYGYYVDQWGNGFVVCWTLRGQFVVFYMSPDESWVKIPFWVDYQEFFSHYLKNSIPDQYAPMIHRGVDHLNDNTAARGEGPLDPTMSLALAVSTKRQNAIYLESYATPPSVEEDFILTKTQKELLKEIQWWARNRDWFWAKGLPWKQGLLIYGPPGTGKTSFIVWMSKQLNAQLHICDLSSLSNGEFLSVVRLSQHNPHIISILLFEDLDRVDFKTTKLTLDWFLQVIGGAVTLQSCLIIATANHPENLDPAIGMPLKEGGGITTRPGRFDKAVYFGLPDQGVKNKLLEKMLPHCKDRWPYLLEAGEQDSHAQFVFRCQLEASCNFQESTPMD